MATKLEAYNEAKSICERYMNYSGDKRSMTYKTLQRSVIECFMGRMNTFGKALGLPTFIEFFHNNN